MHPRLYCAPLKGCTDPLQQQLLSNMSFLSPSKTQSCMPRSHLHQKSLCRKDTPCQKQEPLCWERCPKLPKGQAASHPDLCRILLGHLQ